MADPIKLEKIFQPINKNKKNQILNNIFFYILTPLVFILLISTPIWHPTMKGFLHITLPKISALFSSSKFLFVVGNLIVVILVGESKIFSSTEKSPPICSDVYYEEYVSEIRRSSNLYVREGRNGKKLEKKYLEKHEEKQQEISLPAEELSKRADELIARVNKQRRLEAKLL